MVCKWCGDEIRSLNSIRMGACYKCVEIESIVIDGEDMDMPFVKNEYNVCVTKDEKIKLIQKHYPTVDPYYWYTFHIKRSRKMKLDKIRKNG